MIYDSSEAQKPAEVKIDSQRSKKKEEERKEIIEEVKEEKPVEFSKAVQDNPFSNAKIQEEIPAEVARPSEIVESEEVKDKKRRQ